MSQSKPTSWINTREIFLVTCLVIVAIGLLIYLTGHNTQSQAVEELVQAVESFNVPETEKALKKVKLNEATELAVPRLIELLDSNPKTIYAPTLSLAFTELGSDSISGLVEKVQPVEETKTRTQAMYMLSKIASGHENQEVAQALIQALNDEDKNVRFSAAQAIAHIDTTKASETLPILVELLKDPSGSIRAESIYHIGLFGKRAEAVLPKVLLALKDPVATVRVIAAKSVCKVGTPDKRVIDALSEMLFDENLSCQSEAALALGQLGSQSEPAVSAILDALKLLKNPDRHSKRQQELTRSSMVNALGAIGSAKPEVIQTLIDTLNEKKYGISRVAAATSLKNLGPKAIKAVPVLVKIIDESKEELKGHSEISPAAKLQMELQLDHRLSSEAAIALREIDLETFERVCDESSSEAK